MHVILMSWEFPPRTNGLISRNTEKIARGLSKSDCKVDVVTWNDRVTGVEDHKDGFRVHRVANAVRTHVNIVTWALTLNTELERVASDIIYESEDQSKLVHASEWICAPAAIQLKKTLHTPYVLSLYSTESERSVHGGSLSAAITYLEKSGSLQAAKIVVDNAARALIVEKNYGVPADKLIILDLATVSISKLIEQYQASLPAQGQPKEPRDRQ